MILLLVKIFRFTPTIYLALPRVNITSQVVCVVLQTAETFARSTGQEIAEELASMRNRQHIQRLVRRTNIILK